MSRGTERFTSAKEVEPSLQDKLKTVTWATIKAEHFDAIENADISSMAEAKSIIAILVNAARQLQADNQWYKDELAKK